MYLLLDSNISRKMVRSTIKENNQRFKKKVNAFKWIANTFMARIATGAITFGVLQEINNPSGLEQRVIASDTIVQEQASEKESAEIKEVRGVNYVAKEKATLGYKNILLKKGIVTGVLLKILTGLVQLI